MRVYVWKGVWAARWPGATDDDAGFLWFLSSRRRRRFFYFTFSLLSSSFFSVCGFFRLCGAAQFGVWRPSLLQIERVSGPPGKGDSRLPNSLRVRCPPPPFLPGDLSVCRRGKHRQTDGRPRQSVCWRTAGWQQRLLLALYVWPPLGACPLAASTAARCGRGKKSPSNAVAHCFSFFFFTSGQM